MNISTTIRYRNLFILIATFCVLCLSPLADIHLEGSTETKSYTHGQEHNETTFSMLIHELLFIHLQHTFDHLTLGVSHQNLQKSKNLTSKRTIFSTYTQPIFDSNYQTIAVYSSTSINFLHKNKQKAGIYSRKLSGLSPPNILS